MAGLLIPVYCRITQTGGDSDSRKPAHKNGRPSFEPPVLFESIWLEGRDANPDSQIQSLESYQWTTSQQEEFEFTGRDSACQPTQTSLPTPPANLCFWSFTP